MWRRLFRTLATTIRRDEEFRASRRAFLQLMSTLSGAYFLAGLPVAWRALRPSPSVVRRRTLIARVSEVPVGGATLFHYPGPNDPAILVRLGPETWRAYSQKCTHLLCPVQWRADERVLHCPCHEGYFDPEDGRPRQGPPRRPLPEITLEITNDRIYAVGRRTPSGA